MLTSKSGFLSASIFAFMGFSATALHAEESPISFSTNAAVVSEYRFRGVDLSGGDPAFQAGVDVGLPSGFYVGTWASNIDNATVGYGGSEIDVYGGWSDEVAPGLKLDIGGIRYINSDAPQGDYDYNELYTKLGFSFGPANMKLGAFYAPKQDSLRGMDNLYFSSDLSVGVPATPFTLSAHAGYTDGFLTFTPDSKAWDWSLGASASIPATPLTLGVSYVDAEGGPYAADAYKFTKSGVVVSLSAAF